MRKLAANEELIINGGFDSTLDGWDISGNAHPVNGYAQLATSASISQSPSVVGGTDLVLSYGATLGFGGSAHVVVRSYPSNTRLFEVQGSSVGDEPGATLPVPPGDSSVTVTFLCMSGELDIDNVSLQGEVNDELIINGGFDDDATGWTMVDAVPEKPAVVEGQLHFTDSSNVTQNTYQDVVVTSGRTLQLSYSMELLAAQNGSATVTALSTGQVLYEDTVGGDISGQTFEVPESETTVRVQFTGTLSTEVNVDNVSMKYV